jgi:hypothetical protein
VKQRSVLGTGTPVQQPLALALLLTRAEPSSSANLPSGSWRATASASSTGSKPFRPEQVRAAAVTP